MLSKFKSWFYGAEGEANGSDEGNVEGDNRGDENERPSPLDAFEVAGNVDVDDLEEDPAMQDLIERCKLMFTGTNDVVSMSQFLEPSKLVVSLYEEFDPSTLVKLQNSLRSQFLEAEASDRGNDAKDGVFSHVIVELAEDELDFEETCGASDSDDDAADVSGLRTANLKTTYSRAVILTPPDSEGRVWIFLYDDGRVIFAGQKEMGTTWHQITYDDSIPTRYGLLLIGTKGDDLESGVTIGECRDLPKAVMDELQDWFHQNERCLLVGKREVTSCVFEGDLKSFNDNDEDSLYSAFMLKKISSVSKE